MVYVFMMIFLNDFYNLKYDLNNPSKLNDLIILN